MSYQIDYTELETPARPRMKPKAFCTSAKCHDGYFRDIKTGAEKQVPPNTIWCPDCQCALWWGNPEEARREAMNESFKK